MRTFFLLVSYCLTSECAWWDSYDNPSNSEVLRWNRYIDIGVLSQNNALNISLVHTDKTFTEFAWNNNLNSYVSHVEWYFYKKEDPVLLEVDHGRIEFGNFKHVFLSKNISNCQAYRFDIYLRPLNSGMDPWFDSKSTYITSSPQISATINDVGPTWAHVSFQGDDQDCQVSDFSFTCNKMNPLTKVTKEREIKIENLFPDTAYTDCVTHFLFYSTKKRFIQQSWTRAANTISFNTSQVDFQLTNWTSNSVDLLMNESLAEHLNYYLSYSDSHQGMEKKYILLNESFTTINDLGPFQEYKFCMIITAQGVQQEQQGCSNCLVSEIESVFNLNADSFVMKWKEESLYVVNISAQMNKLWHEYTINATDPKEGFNLDDLDVLIKPKCSYSNSLIDFIRQRPSPRNTFPFIIEDNNYDLSFTLHEAANKSIRNTVCAVVRLNKVEPICGPSFLKNCIYPRSVCKIGRTKEAVYFSDAQVVAVYSYSGTGIALVLVLLVAMSVFMGTKYKHVFQRQMSGHQQPEYNALKSIGPSNPILVSEFVSKLRNGEISFREEFEELDQAETLKITLNKTTNQGIQHSELNRYNNILPYDDTCVILDGQSARYINASWILRPSVKGVAYIATQGPTASTIKDFWKMVFDKRVHIIVMLTKLIEKRDGDGLSVVKCEQYWPKMNKETHGDYLIELIDERSPLPQLEERTFKVKDLKSGSFHMVLQLHYVGWPDHGTPSSPNKLLALHSELRKKRNSLCPESKDLLILVHCSAGVGRTGTLLALDSITQEIDKGHADVDVLKTVFELRTNRCHMVQQLIQYKYLYNCVGSYINTNVNKKQVLSRRNNDEIEVKYL